MHPFLQWSDRIVIFLKEIFFWKTKYKTNSDLKNNSLSNISVIFKIPIDLWYHICQKNSIGFGHSERAYCSFLKIVKAHKWTLSRKCIALVFRFLILCRFKYNFKLLECMGHEIITNPRVQSKKKIFHAWHRQNIDTQQITKINMIKNNDKFCRRKNTCI